MDKVKEFLRKRAGENSSRLSFFMLISNAFGLGLAEDQVVAISSFVGAAISLAIMFIPDKGNE